VADDTERPSCGWCDGTLKAAFERGETIVQTLPICPSCKAKLDAMWEKIDARLIVPTPALNAPSEEASDV
jgi:hypothetical protein